MKRNIIFIIIALMSCALDIFSKYLVFQKFGAVILDREKQISHKYLFAVPSNHKRSFSNPSISKELRDFFAGQKSSISQSATMKKINAEEIWIIPEGMRNYYNLQEIWMICDTEKYYLILTENRSLNVYFYNYEFSKYKPVGEYVLVLENYRAYVVIPKFFNICVVLNRGAVWGSFQGRVGMLTFFSIAAILFILYLTWKKNYSNLYQISLGLIMGGAIGNLWDRVWFGGVRDFLDFHISQYHWPTFNLADVYIVVGIAVYLLLECYHGNQDKEKSASAASGATAT